MITIIRWWKLKAKQIKFKLAFYEVVDNFINNSKDIVPVVKNVYEAIKDVPVEDMKEALVSAIAETVHNDTNIKK